MTISVLSVKTNFKSTSVSKYTYKLCQQGVISEENATAFIDAMDIVAELYRNYKNIPKTEIEHISNRITSYNVCYTKLLRYKHYRKSLTH